MRKNLSPEWGEKFQFDVRQIGLHNPPLLRMEVWDRNWVWDGELCSLMKIESTYIFSELLVFTIQISFQKNDE